RSPWCWGRRWACPATASWRRDCEGFRRMSVVDIENLRISFATDAGTVAAVKDVSLSVEAGEVLAIVGESGSGKTVTARSILRLLPETATTRGAVVLSRRDGTDQHD